MLIIRILVGIVLLLCFALIFWIIAKHWSSLKDLDVTFLEKEKQNQLKDHIIRQRVIRQASSLGRMFDVVFSPWRNWIRNPLKRMYHGLKAKEQSLKTPKKEIKTQQGQEHIRKLLQQADDCLLKEDYTQAEKYCIEAVSLDARHIKAYKLLSEVYEKQKEWKSAKEVLKHILVLDRQDMESYVRLTRVLHELQQDKLALAQLKLAIEMKTNNPKYLHQMVELSILMKDFSLGKQALNQLMVVNPTNQKITEFKDKLGMPR